MDESVLEPVVTIELLAEEAVLGGALGFSHTNVVAVMVMVMVSLLS